MNESTVNVPLLRKTLDWAYDQYQLSLRGLPSEWSQGEWIRHSSAVSCGTVCCVAGKIALEAGWRSLHGDGGSVVIQDGVIDFANAVAADELGLTRDQAEALFSGGNTIGMLYAIAGQLTDGEITAPPELNVPDISETRCPCGCDLPAF